MIADDSGLPRRVALPGSGDACTRLMATHQLPLFAQPGVMAGMDRGIDPQAARQWLQALPTPASGA